MNKKKNTSKTKKENKLFTLDKLSNKTRLIISIVLISLPLLMYFVPYAVDNVQPTGTDFLSNVGQTHNWVEWNKQTGETALWNPNIFGGEPIYPRLTPKLLHIDTLLSALGQVFYWASWYLFIGGLGIFFLLKYKKVPWYAAVIVAIIFVLLPDWQAQIGEGHNSKLRALMVIPWFILSFSYFFEKKSWLSTGLFALAFSWLVRTHHFQIIFYGILILFFLYVYPTIKMFIKKQFKDVGSLILKFVIALLLTLMTAAQPLFTTSEYAKYSIRGGNPVQIGKDSKSAKKASGVDLNYATQWSFSPNEIMDFFIPHFSGGISNEIYDGDKFPQLKGRQIPGYWGEKPFSGNYAFVGMIMFLFAIIGVIYNRKDKFVIGLAVFSIFSILLSFGRHFPELYKLFFYYVPYFSKFRAPAMTLNSTFITILLLAGYGLKSFLEEVKTKDAKTIFTVFGLSIASLALVYASYSSFSFSTPQEVNQYDSNTINLLKQIREEFLLRDLSRLLIIMVVTFGFVAAYLFDKIKKEIFLAAILVLSFIDVYNVSHRAHSIIQLGNTEKLEKNIFKQTPITNVLSKDNSKMRAIVLGGREFTSNHYAYYYPLINGYSAIKLQIVQDVIEHNLFSAKTSDKINWNVINMLGGKFIISPAQLNNSFLSPVAQDKDKKHLLYVNNNALSKAWFINEIKPFSTPEDLVLFMNESEFKPDSIACVTNNNLSGKFTGKGSVNLVTHNPNYIEFNVETKTKQFLVVSEIYYPEGWIAKLDDKEIEIYQVNHLLRGVNIDAGKHKLTLEFKPQTYYTSLNFLWIGNILILLLIVVPFILTLRKN